MTYIWRNDIQSRITMGSEGKSGGGRGGTTTTTTSPPPWLASAYQSLIGQAQNVAATPYTPYTGQLVSGFSPDQTTAGNTIAGAQGMTQPYTQQATADVNAGTQSIYPNLQQYNQNNLSQYQNPYTNDVINSTMALANQQDAQQQSQLSGNAIQSGASPFGGDRAGVAAAALAGQQNLANNQTIAGLNNQNFAQAQAELNNQQQLQANTQASDAWRQLSGGQELGGLGTQAQTNTLGQASAQLQSGALQQQLAQEQLNVPYEQYLAQKAYPFQTTGWLGSLESGLGGVSGGTSSTTAPAASTASQLGGLGLTGLVGIGATGGFGSGGWLYNSANPGSDFVGPLMPNQSGGLLNGLFKDGGVAGKHLASGGNSSIPGDENFISGITGGIPDVSVDYIPSIQMSGRTDLPSAPKPDQQSGGISLGDISSLKNIFSGSSGIAQSQSSSFKYGGGTQHKAFGGEVLPIVGDIAGAFFGDPGAGGQLQTGMDLLDKIKSGGVAGHYDTGGMITNPMQAQMAGANPMQQQQASQYNNMSLNQLMQAATMQPNNPMIQRAIQQKKMSGGMASGGVMPHFDDGGTTPAEQVLQDIANEPTGVSNAAQNLTSNPTSQGIAPVNASDLLPPDARGVSAPAEVINHASQPLPTPEGELDAKPAVDHSGDTVKLHSEGKVLDTGLPSFKDTSMASSPWEPLLAAGLGMMAGRSPNALTNIGEGGLAGLQALGAQRAAALKENQAQTEQQKLQDDLALRRQEMQNTQAYQTGELAHGTASLAQQAAQQKIENSLRQQQLEQGKFQPVKDVFGNVTGVMNTKTGQVNPSNPIAGQDAASDIINQAPSSNPQEAASQILAEQGTTPAQVMSRQDISGRNTQNAAYQNSALAAKKAIQELDSLNAQTGKYTPGKVANWGYGGESVIGMGGEGATARTEADKASKNLANAFMQANAGSKGSGIRMVEFDAGAVPNADMPDAARNELIAKNKAVANSQIQRAVISNLYPHMQIANVNSIMDNYEQKNPPVMANGSANPKWMPYQDWLKAGRPDTGAAAVASSGNGQSSGTATHKYNPATGNLEAIQ